MTQAYENQFNLSWLKPSPMNSTNLMVVTREVAQHLHEEKS